MEKCARKHGGDGVAPDPAAVGSRSRRRCRHCDGAAGQPCRGRADGSHESIAGIRPGDTVLSTDPESGRSSAEKVINTYRHDARDLLEVTLDGAARLTTTPGHWLYADGRGWTVASDLRIGDRLRGRGEGWSLVTALTTRRAESPTTVYDLSVERIHTFHVRTVGDRAGDYLVHNCFDLLGDEGLEGAHTLRDHVNPTPDEARAFAQEKGINTVWVDKETASQVVDYGLADFFSGANAAANRRRLNRWLTNGVIGDKFPAIKGTFGARNSLGRAYKKRPDGSIEEYATANQYSIVLKKAPGHKLGFVVFTAFPEGRL
ncbi:polymorphic toxin-type HINT domain-containing protein [Streptomyces sp. NPDC046887]|uniref:polymorphic toxin-type HINT domain-containing protein n=1 Tax=Streptomyces sp. NPDC046887 TaxID=3155472 RepID=UPI0033C5DB01